MTTGVFLESTFLDALQRSLSACGDRPALTFLVDGEAERAETYSFAELDDMARVVAADLQMSGVHPGDRVMLLQTPGRHMVAGFVGCIYAGAIAVPAYPPTPFLGTQGNERLLGIRKDASATAVLTTSELLPLLKFPDEGDAEPLSWVFTDKPQSTAADYVPVEVNPEDVAFLQYTSGSTALPRGVRVTQGALVANIKMTVELFQLHQDSIACSWLPPFHDMGLIATILTPLAIGCRTIQMAPEAFLRRPDRWLRAIAQYRATFSWAPNFAYELCIRRIQALDGVDLTCWILAGNGAEPVKERTLAEFSRKFADYGLRPESLWVGYGLAEATLLVSARQRGPGSTMWVDPDQLSDGRLVPTEAALGRPLVSCGASAPYTTVTIRDPETGQILDDGIVGEIWVAGPQVCDGYWQRPALTADMFPGGVLRTGDLGAISQGELYVTGRIKDLLIVRGRNHYPQDIEQTMEAADPNLRAGCGVAVSVRTGSEELLVLIQEVAPNSSGDPELIVEKMRRLVTEQHGISADAVVLVRPRTVPKTTSGKLRRSTAAESFRTGTLRVVHQWAAKARS
jgi:acyl-CoA synthetase (AMP-forming)/AMP-acid ligase II